MLTKNVNGIYSLYIWLCFSVSILENRIEMNFKLIKEREPMDLYSTGLVHYSFINSKDKIKLYSMFYSLKMYWFELVKLWILKTKCLIWSTLVIRWRMYHVLQTCTKPCTMAYKCYSKYNFNSFVLPLMKRFPNRWDGRKGREGRVGGQAIWLAAILWLTRASSQKLQEMFTLNFLKKNLISGTSYYDFS